MGLTAVDLCDSTCTSPSFERDVARVLLDLPAESSRLKEALTCPHIKPTEPQTKRIAAKHRTILTSHDGAVNKNHTINARVKIINGIKNACHEGRPTWVNEGV